MGYYIDLNSISLETYKLKLKNSDLLRSRMMLKEKIDERFSSFESLGIKNLLELQRTLKNKKSYRDLVNQNGLNEEYLSILLREINSMHPKPNRIREFQSILRSTVEKLESIGIKDTYMLFEKVKTPARRKALSDQTGIHESEILKLTRLTDLSRIKWVGVTFACLLLEIGIDSVERASSADYKDLHQRVCRYNKEKKFFKGQIGLNDMKLFVNAACEVPSEIEY